MVVAYLRSGRVIGVTAAHKGSGASRVAEMLATLSARSGARTLLVRLSRPMTEYNGEAKKVWRPGLPLAQYVRHGRSYDLLPAWPAGRHAFTSSNEFRDILENDLAEYATIIVDLPDLEGHGAGTGVEPLIAAGACNGVMLVCLKDRTCCDEVTWAVERLRVAGATIVGTILNDVDEEAAYESEGFVEADEAVDYHRAVRNDRPEDAPRAIQAHDHRHVRAVLPGGVVAEQR